MKQQKEKQPVHPIERGTQIGEVECMGCGAVKPLKVNSAGCVYMFCREPVGERNGKREDCFTRLNIGRTASEKIIQQFLENQGDITNAEQKLEDIRGREEAPAGAAGSPEDRPEQPAAEHSGGDEEPADPRAGGLGSALKHFITGD